MSISEHGPAGTTPPAEPPRGRRRGLGAGAVAAIAVVALALGAVGGYLLGHGRGEDAGYDDGVADGRAQVERRYRPGAHGYEVIYARGRREGERAGRAAGERAGRAEGERDGLARGRKVGFEEGERVGITTGEREGVRQGAAAVLGGFDAWSEGAYYIVTASPGPEPGVPFTLSSRTQVQPGRSYHLCADGGLCEAPLASVDGGGAGTPDADLGAGG